MKSVEEILLKVGESGASDLHLKVGSPPVIRVDGQLINLDEPPCSPDDTKEFAAGLMNEKQLRRFSEANEIDFAFSAPNVGRFRVDIYRQRGMAETQTTELASRLITQVSGGERQLVVLARALAQATPILFLDEATASLDVRRKLDVFDLLTDLNRGRNLTVLAVMHDVNLATQYCHRLILLKNRSIFRDGDTFSTCRPEVLETVYETPVLVEPHPATGRPCVHFLPRGVGGGEGQGAQITNKL